MELAYVDSSCLVAVLLGEKGSTAVRKRLARTEVVFASGLLEAEVLAAAARERVSHDGVGAALAALRWVFPQRSLASEIGRVLHVGYLRGADVWHLACALFSASRSAFCPS